MPTLREHARTARKTSSYRDMRYHTNISACGRFTSRGKHGHATVYQQPATGTYGFLRHRQRASATAALPPSTRLRYPDASCNVPRPAFLGYRSAGSAI